MRRWPTKLVGHLDRTACRGKGWCTHACPCPYLVCRQEFVQRADQVVFAEQSYIELADPKPNAVVKATEAVIPSGSFGRGLGEPLLKPADGGASIQERSNLILKLSR